MENYFKLCSSQQYHNMARIGAQWFLTRKGICAGNQLHAGAFIRSRADTEIDHPDIQFHFLPSQVIDHGRKNPTIEAYQVHVGTLRAKSVGYLKIKVCSKKNSEIFYQTFSRPTRVNIQLLIQNILRIPPICPIWSLL